MKILIACHCKETRPGFPVHAPLTLETGVRSAHPSIFYMDVSEGCTPQKNGSQFHQWKTMGASQFDFIWFHHCPLWDFDMGLPILAAAYRTLKPNGRIITPLYSTIHKEDRPLPGKMVTFLGKHGIHYTMKTTAKPPFIMKEKGEEKSDLYLEFHKSDGKRHGKKTRRKRRSL